MTDKLKPCPFCGGEAQLIKGWCELDNYVMCLSCRTRTKPMNTKESAIKAWNTRKPMDRIVEQLEETFDRWGLDEGKKEIMRKVVKADVPDTNVGKWIPCSERLPKKEGRYLATVEVGVPKLKMIKEVHFKRGRFFGQSNGNNVVAWMPLPDIYKGE